LVPERSQAFTPNTLTRRESVLKELEATRKTGLSYDREERVVGVYCIGAPVFDVTGNAVAGLGITGLVSRIQAEVRPRFEVNVLACAENVSKDIGYRGDAFAKFRDGRSTAK
jgi:IclR family acetate operon transcriptional repressor